MNRNRLLMISVIVAAVAGLSWSYGFMAAKRSYALVAGADVEACGEMVGKIGRLSHRPTLASDSERLADEIHGLVEKAARSAGIGAQGILRITHEQPQRLGNSAYKEKPTLVALRNVSLQQLTDMIYGLSSQDKGLSAKVIRLTTPASQEASDLWNAEVAVSYLIFDPMHPEK